MTMEAEAPQLHMTNPDGSVNGNFDAALGELLTSGSDVGRLFGRAVASGITQAVMDWCNAEIERGTEPAMIMIALTQLQVQQVASLAGNFVTAAGTDVVLQGYQATLDMHFVSHAQRIRELLAAERRSDTQTQEQAG